MSHPFLKHVFLGFLFVGVLGGLLHEAHAQTTSAYYGQTTGTYYGQTTGTSAYYGSSCVALSVDLSVGSSDQYTGGQVSTLQNFLGSQGYFPYQPTGLFSTLTQRAVQNFQAGHGISATGYVGVQTRALIQQISCGGTPTPVPTPIPPVSVPYISSITPMSGSVGTSVTISGYGFSSDNTILFGGGAIYHVPISSTIAVACTNDPTCRGGLRQTLVFTVPTYLSPYCAPGMMCAQYMQTVTPGTYGVSVMNSNGSSNAITFTVLGGSAGGSISITNLDAPSQLLVGQNGTWTVRANTSGLPGNLHYSVVWGDESINPSAYNNPIQVTTQTSATFTHAYMRVGTYTPVFTVTSDSGQTATVNASTLVTYSGGGTQGTGQLMGTLTFSPVCYLSGSVGTSCPLNSSIYGNRPIYVYSSDASTLVATLTPDASGRFSTSLPTGNYLVDFVRPVSGSAALANIYVYPGSTANLNLSLGASVY